MIELIPSVPQSCQVIGFLYHSDDRTMLGEDMVDVVLSNGILISAGWYPEGDTNGSYRVVATRGFSTIRELKTDDVAEANTAVEDLARRLSGPGHFVADTADQALEPLKLELECA